MYLQILHFKQQELRFKGKVLHFALENIEHRPPYHAFQETYEPFPAWCFKSWMARKEHALLNIFFKSKSTLYSKEKALHITLENIKTSNSTSRFPKNKCEPILTWCFRLWMARMERALLYTPWARYLAARYTGTRDVCLQQEGSHVSHMHK